MKQVRNSLVLLLFACLLLSSACVKQSARQAGPLDVYRNGKLDEAGTDIADVAFVSVRDSTTLVGNLHGEIERRLRTHGIQLTGNPSQAGYILQISVLACAPSSTDNLKKSVDAGYGAPVTLSGKGHTALVTDALLVLRRQETGPAKHLQPAGCGQQPDAARPPGPQGLGYHQKPASRRGRHAGGGDMHPHPASCRRNGRPARRAGACPKGREKSRRQKIIRQDVSSAPGQNIFPGPPRRGKLSFRHAPRGFALTFQGLLGPDVLRKNAVLPLTFGLAALFC